MAKESSRCLHYLLAAILEDQGEPPTWRLHTSLLRGGSSVRYINPLCEVYCRRKVEWIDQLCLHLHYSADPRSTPPRKKDLWPLPGGRDQLCLRSHLIVRPMTLAIMTKYEKVFGGKCSPTKTSELLSHMLGWKVNNVPRSYFSSLNAVNHP